MKTTNKSGRKRGAILMFLRSVATSKRQFRVSDVVPPLTIQQAYTNLHNMILNGEIQKDLTFQKTAGLRSPELTNRHL